MAATITHQSINQTEKGFRVDCTFQQSGFFSGSTETKIRFMGSGDFDENLLPAICKEVIENKDDWKAGKKSQTLALSTIRSTAIILNHQNLD